MRLTDETVGLDVQVTGGGGAEIAMSLIAGGSVLCLNLSNIDVARLAGYLQAATERA